MISVWRKKLSKEQPFHDHEVGLFDKEIIKDYYSINFPEDHTLISDSQ